jgi:hypothetical protein
VLSKIDTEEDRVYVFENDFPGKMLNKRVVSSSSNYAILESLTGWCLTRCTLTWRDHAIRIFDTPLQKSESVTARLAPEGINVKEAYQTFGTDTMDSFNVIAGALGTNRLRHLNVSLASQLLLLGLKLFYRFLACL